MNYPEAVVIEVEDEPIIESEVIGIDNRYDVDIVQRKALCCLSISITILIMIIFGYILADSYVY
jgi:hypothetical protein